MKKIFGRLGGILAKLAFAAALVLGLLHLAPKHRATPGDPDPISYHPYVTHGVGETKSAKSS